VSEFLTKFLSDVPLDFALAGLKTGGLRCAGFGPAFEVEKQ